MSERVSVYVNTNPLTHAFPPTPPLFLAYVCLLGLGNQTKVGVGSGEGAPDSQSLRVVGDERGVQDDPHWQEVLTAKQGLLSGSTLDGSPFAVGPANGHGGNNPRKHGKLLLACASSTKSRVHGQVHFGGSYRHYAR